MNINTLLHLPTSENILLWWYFIIWNMNYTVCVMSVHIACGRQGQVSNMTNFSVKRRVHPVECTCLLTSRLEVAFARWSELFFRARTICLWMRLFAFIAMVLRRIENGAILFMSIASSRARGMAFKGTDLVMSLAQYRRSQLFQNPSTLSLLQSVLNRTSIFFPTKSESSVPKLQLNVAIYITSISLLPVLISNIPVPLSNILVLLINYFSITMNIE